ncbi:MAG TPA: hypothetical protein VM925_04865, partial [Labilithrix sp.]|nr:hypothetical protein [Labilithrix sp.]
MPPARHGYVMEGAAVYPAHYARPPAAPGSLSPVAMSALGGALATGPQIAQASSGLTRPPVRTGVAILVAGTIIGGVLGILLRAPRSVAGKTETAEQPPAASPAPSAA